MDIAELGLSIRSDGVVVATNRLRDLEGQAGRTEKAGALLAKAFAVLTAAFSVSKLIDYTNRWTDLSSRVEIATGSIGAGAATMQRLADMARRTYSSFDQTAETFLLNATAMREMGASTNQTLDYVEAINNALVVSGSKGDRAASVMNALGKAMALGKLSGENLNTVLASGDRVASALAESMGVSTLELRALGAAGKITSKDIIGITSQLEKLRAEADSMPATIGDAFTLLGNSIMQMVGQFDQANGASSRVAEAIIFVADAMNSGAISVERLLSYSTAMAAFMAGSWVVSFVAANGAVVALTASLRLMRAALISTGIGALVVVAGELVYQLYNVVEGASSIGDAFGRLKKSGMDTWQRIVSGAEFMYLSIAAYASDIQAAYMTTWGNILNGFLGMLRQIGAATGTEIPGLKGFEDTVLSTQMAGAEAHTRALEQRAQAAKALLAVFEDKNRTDDIGRMPSFGELGSTMGKPGSLTLPAGIDAAAGKAAEKYKDLVRGAHEFIAAQQLEAQALGMTEEAASRLRHEQDLLNKAANDNLDLSPRQREELGGLASAMAAVEERTRRLNETYELGKSTLSRALGDMRQGLMSGTSFWDTLGNAATNALDGITQRLTEMASNSLWDMLFNGLMGGFGGGNFIGGTAGAPALQLGFQKGIPGFASGTSSAPGGLSWVGEQGPELMNVPRGAQIFPHQKSMAMAANQNQNNDNGAVTVRLLMPDGWKAEVVEEARTGARADTVRIVQANDEAQRNYRQNGGN